MYESWWRWGESNSRSSISLFAWGWRWTLPRLHHEHGGGKVTAAIPEGLSNTSTIPPMLKKVITRRPEGSATVRKSSMAAAIALGVGVGAAIGASTGNLVTGVGLGLMFGILAVTAARKIRS